MPLVANEYFVACMYVREKLEGMSRKCCACFLFGMNDSSSFFRGAHLAALLLAISKASHYKDS